MYTFRIKPQSLYVFFFIKKKKKPKIKRRVFKKSPECLRVNGALKNGTVGVTGFGGSGQNPTPTSRKTRRRVLCFRRVHREIAKRKKEFFFQKKKRKPRYNEHCRVSTNRTRAREVLQEPVMPTLQPYRS